MNALTKFQTKILKRLVNGEHIDGRSCSKDEDQVCAFFYDKGLTKMICPDPNDEGWVPCIYVITELGRQEYYEKIEAKKKVVIDNIKYLITTTIALAAFIKSFFFI